MPASAGNFSKQIKSTFTWFWMWYPNLCFRICNFFLDIFKTCTEFPDPLRARKVSSAMKIRTAWIESWPQTILWRFYLIKSFLLFLPYPDTIIFDHVYQLLALKTLISEYYYKCKPLWRRFEAPGLSLEVIRIYNKILILCLQSLVMKR